MVNRFSKITRTFHNNLSYCLKSVKCFAAVKCWKNLEYNNTILEFF